MRGIIIVTVLTLVPLFTVHGQGRLLGLVTDEQGLPLRAAVVSLTSAEFTQAAVSNASGYYAFISVPFGSYTLKVNKSGLPQVTSPVSFNAPVMKRVDVRLASIVPIDITDAKRPKPEAKESKEKRPENIEKKPVDVAKVEPTKTADTKPVETKSTVVVSADTSVLANARLKEALDDAEEIEKSEKATLETKPEIIGGMNALYEKLIYPAIAREQNIEGDVVAKVFVDRNGFASRVTLVKTASPVLNDEVFRVLSEDMRFKPATVSGKSVAGVATILVTFRGERSLMPLQAAMFSKVFGYEQTLSKKPMVNIAIVYSNDADIDGNELAKQFQTAKTTAEFVSESKLAESISKFDVIYVLPTVNAKAVQAVAAKFEKLTATSTSRFVEQGFISLAIDADEQGKSKITLNKKSLERERKSFAEPLLKLAKVIE